MGSDHFAHAFAYSMMASGRVWLAKTPEEVVRKKMLRSLGLEEERRYDQLRFGLDQSGDYDPLQF
jgi:hypothetical protein